jgi:hypothetical protein
VVNIDLNYWSIRGSMFLEFHAREIPARLASCFLEIHRALQKTSSTDLTEYCSPSVGGTRQRSSGGTSSPSKFNLPP